MKELILSNGMKAKLDDEDYERVCVAGNWYADTIGHGTRVYAYRQFPTGKVYLHKFVLAYKGPLDVDHIDGDGLNCQKKNLRTVSRSANNINQKQLKSNNSSGIKGVYWDSHYFKWKAEIKLHGRKFNLGTFATKEEAAAARKTAEERVDSGLPPKEAKCRGKTFKGVELTKFTLPKKESNV